MSLMIHHCVKQLQLYPSWLKLKNESPETNSNDRKIGYTHVKYRSNKLMNNQEQSEASLDRIYHCAKKQHPMWFGSRMRAQKQIPMTQNRL